MEGGLRKDCDRSSRASRSMVICVSRLPLLGRLTVSFGDVMGEKRSLCSSYIETRFEIFHRLRGVVDYFRRFFIFANAIVVCPWSCSSCCASKNVSNLLDCDEPLIAKMFRFFFSCDKSSHPRRHFNCLICWVTCLPSCRCFLIRLLKVVRLECPAVKWWTAVPSAERSFQEYLHLMSIKFLGNWIAKSRNNGDSKPQAKNRRI